MSDSRIHHGDVYCPNCGSLSIAFDFTTTKTSWFCDHCDAHWEWDHDGVDWVWPDDRKRWPGCPYCGTRNISLHESDDDRVAPWSCGRELCNRWWRGFWTLYSDGRMRWTIRIPARDVPFRRTLDNPTTYPHQETS